MYKVLGSWMLFLTIVKATTGDILKIQPFRVFNEGDNLQFKCTDSNKGRFGFVPLIWLTFNEAGDRMINAEEGTRQTVQIIPDCENRDDTCIKLIIPSLGWYDNRTLFRCCRSNDSATCLGKNLAMRVNNTSKMNISIKVNYKVHSSSTIFTYPGEDVRLTCPIDIKHTRIKLVWERKIGKHQFVSLTNETASTPKKYHHVGKLTDAKSIFKCVAMSTRGKAANRRTHKIKVIMTDGVLLRMNNVTVKKGRERSALLTCLVFPKNVSVTKIKWFKEGQPIPNNISKQGVGARKSYIIRPFDVFKDDIAGKYKCHVEAGKYKSNVVGRITVKGVLVVTLIAPNTMIEGGNYTFRCNTTKTKNGVNYAWKLNNKSLSVRDTAINTYHVSDAKLYDQGLYECIANNSQGSSTDQKMIEVEYKPKVTVPNAVVIENQDAVMVCNVKSNPPFTKLVWYFNNTSLKREETGQQLLIVNAKRNTSQGLYKCSVTNKIGQSSGEGRLTIVDSEFSTVPKDIYVLENSTNTLQCRVNRYIIGTLGWVRNNKEITRDDKVLEPTEQETYATSFQDYPKSHKYDLKIKNIKFRHAGTYVCCIGDKCAQGSVTVRAPPAVPRIEIPFNLIEGQTVTFSCMSKNGFPKAMITWYENNARLRSTHKYNGIMNNIHIHKWNFLNSRDVGSFLKITLTRRQHNATIKCKAENDVDSKWSSTTLNVEYTPYIKPLGYERIVGGGGTIDLTCNYEANPPGQFLGWFFTMNKQLSKSIHLKIDRAQANHSGTYTCRVKNKLGSSSRSILIHVVGNYGSIMKLTAEGSSISVIVGGAVAFLAVLSIIPILYVCRKEQTHTRKSKESKIFENYPNEKVASMERDPFYFPEDDRPFGKRNPAEMEDKSSPIWLNIVIDRSGSEGKEKKKKRKTKHGSKTSLASKNSSGSTSDPSKTRDTDTSPNKTKKKKKTKNKKKKHGSNSSLKAKKNSGSTSDQPKTKKQDKQKGASKHNKKKKKKEKKSTES